MSKITAEELQHIKQEIETLQSHFLVLTHKINAVNNFYSKILTREYAQHEKEKRKQQEEDRTLPKQGINQGSPKKNNVKVTSSKSSKRKGSTPNTKR